ncbi:MAG: hypothetical protein ABIL14_01325 [candidate division WOR-3 bacterium]
MTKNTKKPKRKLNISTRGLKLIKSIVLSAILERNFNGYKVLVSYSDLDNKSNYAETSYGGTNRIIVINPRKKMTLEELINTVIHEVLHTLHEDADADDLGLHTSVYEVADQVANLLLPQEKLAILRALVSTLGWL